MIWKAKYTEPNIPSGTTRLKRVFAWLPTNVDGDIVWLQSYDVLQVYVVNSYTARIDDQNKSVQVAQWIDGSKRLIK